MKPATPVPFYVTTVLIEALYFWRFFSNNRKPSTNYIVIVVWLLLIIWEIASTDLKVTHPVLISVPENVFKVFLPYMYPGIVRGMKVQMATAMLMLVMAEMYGATSGMGYFVLNYTNYGNYTNVVAGIICVGIVVTILDCLIGLLINKTVKWSE